MITSENVRKFEFLDLNITEKRNYWLFYMADVWTINVVSSKASKGILIELCCLVLFPTGTYLMWFCHLFGAGLDPHSKILTVKCIFLVYFIRYRLNQDFFSNEKSSVSPKDTEQINLKRT